MLQRSLEYAIRHRARKQRQTLAVPKAKLPIFLQQTEESWLCELSLETRSLAFNTQSLSQEAQMRHLAAAFVLLCPSIAFSAEIPHAKAFASATLPTLEAHLKKIQAIAATAGVSAN